MKSINLGGVFTASELEYKKSQLGTCTPALCEIPKPEVIVAFEKLTLHSDLLTDIRNINFFLEMSDSELILKKESLKKPTF